MTKRNTVKQEIEKLNRDGWHLNIQDMKHDVHSNQTSAHSIVKVIRMRMRQGYESNITTVLKN
jgi:hypothetical protein